MSFRGELREFELPDILQLIASQQKAAKAQEEGRFDREIVPIEAPVGMNRTPAVSSGSPSRVTVPDTGTSPSLNLSLSLPPPHPAHRQTSRTSAIVDFHISGISTDFRQRKDRPPR